MPRLDMRPSGLLRNEHW